MQFMNIKVDTQDSLDEKIDRLMSMMSKLKTQNDDQTKKFKPKIYQSKMRGQTRNLYDCSYGLRNYQNRYRSNSWDRRISFSERIQYGQNNRDRSRYNQNYRGDFWRGNFRGNCDQIRIIEVEIEEIIEMIIMKEVEVGLGRDSVLLILEGMIEVIVGLDQLQELVPIEIESDVINVGNMMILLRIVQLLKWKRNQSKFNKFTIWMQNKLH